MEDFFNDKERIEEFLKKIPNEDYFIGIRTSLVLGRRIGPYPPIEDPIFLLVYLRREETHYINKNVERAYQLFLMSLEKFWDAFFKEGNIKNIDGGKFVFKEESYNKSKSIYISRLATIVGLLNKTQGEYGRFLSVAKRELPRPLSGANTRGEVGRKKTLYLDQDANLYRFPRERFLYQMGKGELPHLIFKFLIDNPGPHTLSEIMFGVNSTSSTSVRGAIYKMKRRITSRLKIHGESVIKSKHGVGYKIGEEYEIEDVES